MTDVQDEHLPLSIIVAQVKSSVLHTQLFLIGTLFVCLYHYITYNYLYKTSLFFLNIWFALISILLILGWAGTTFFQLNQSRSLSRLDLWTQSLYFVVGLALGLGVFVINALVPIDTPYISSLHLIVFSGLLLAVSQTLALAFLTNRLRYFLAIFVPSIIPIIFSGVLFPGILTGFPYFAFILFFVVIFCCAYVLNRTHRDHTDVMIKNRLLTDTHDVHIHQLKQLHQQLQQETDKSKEIEMQMQMHNQLLEQKVKERTYDIEQMNIHLENHTQNLTLAHETAGIRSWTWNIENRSFTITDFSNAENDSIDQPFLIHPEDLPAFTRAIRLHLRNFSPRYEATYRIKTHQEWSWVHDVGQVVARDPKTRKAQRMVGIRRNIQQEKKDQDRLKLASSVLMQADEGIFVLNENLCYVDVNPCFTEITGFSIEQVMHKHLFDITKTLSPSQHQIHLNMAQQLIQESEFDGELNEYFLSGRELTLWVHINAVKDDQHKIINYVGIMTDLTERRKQEQRLSYLENYDALTDLPNRFYYNYQLHHYLVSHSDAIKQLAVIRLNIDRFRSFNEFLNNEAGDELLKQVAQRLRQTNTEALLIAYLNNDDFAIIYELSRHRPTIQHYCKALIHAFSQPFMIQGQEHIITISLGVAFYPEHGRQIDNINHHAEQALVEAKRLGGNAVKYYTKDKTKVLNHGMHLERDLRHAVKNHDLMVYFQPKICCHTHHIHGFEALIRWRHPEYGIISPEFFIPLAEETSLISDIGRFVLHETARHIREWNDLGFEDICVSVNVVAQQIHRGQLLTDLDQALSAYQISNRSLELEITESSLMNNSDHVKDILNAVKERNILISLDDFGTGYSSLAYLTEYPIDVLKIDRAFISKIGDKKQEAIVSAMIAMGKTMGLTLVAEGVETLEQVKFLEQQGCDYLQGYYFSKPLDPIASTEYLKQHQFIPV